MSAVVQKTGQGNPKWFLVGAESTRPQLVLRSARPPPLPLLLRHLHTRHQCQKRLPPDLSSHFLLPYFTFPLSSFVGMDALQSSQA
jgi:hypothetical protein